MTAVVLTVGTGATDVASFTRLGGVFTSVMTGNLVLFGLAAAKASRALAGHTALSVAGFVLGVAVGARVLAGRAGRATAAGPTAAGPTADRRERPAKEPAAGRQEEPAAGRREGPAEEPTAEEPGTERREEPAGERAAEEPAAGRREGSADAWPALVTWALTIEFALLAAFAAGWELAGSKPAGLDQYLLQVTAAVAMGMQSAAVRGIGASDVSTTYMTGALTQFVARLATPGPGRWTGWRLPGPLLALATGALVNGVLIAKAPAAAPVFVVLPLCLVLAATRRPGTRVRSRWRRRDQTRPASRRDPA
ncbi:MAG TPA: DUF1275 family protein [Streptosporangiaceae bacterium]